MKYYLFSFVMLCLIACNDDAQFQKLDVNKAKILRDTILTFQSSDSSWNTEVYPPFANKMNHNWIIIDYPASTKKIKSYVFGHAINGSGLLTVTCDDNSTYPIKLKSTVAVAAASSLLQAKYVRVDTTDFSLFAYTNY